MPWHSHQAWPRITRALLRAPLTCVAERLWTLSNSMLTHRVLTWGGIYPWVRPRLEALPSRRPHPESGDTTPSRGLSPRRLCSVALDPLESLPWWPTAEVPLPALCCTLWTLSGVRRSLINTFELMVSVSANTILAIGRGIRCSLACLPIARRRITRLCAMSLPGRVAIEHGSKLDPRF